MLEIDNDIILIEPLEIKYGAIDIYDIDDLIIDILQKYEEVLESSYMRSAYIYSMYLVINPCALQYKW